MAFCSRPRAWPASKASRILAIMVDETTYPHPRPIAPVKRRGTEDLYGFSYRSSASTRSSRALTSGNARPLGFERSAASTTDANTAPIAAHSASGRRPRDPPRIPRIAVAGPCRIDESLTGALAYWIRRRSWRRRAAIRARRLCRPMALSRNAVSRSHRQCPPAPRSARSPPRSEGKTTRRARSRDRRRGDDRCIRPKNIHRDDGPLRQLGERATRSPLSRGVCGAT